MGGADWAPEDAAVQAADADGDGLWTLTGQLAAGSYEFKAAVNNSWDENYGAGGTAGGDNIPLVLEAGADVTFFYDRATNAVWAEVGGAVVAGAKVAAPAEPVTTSGPDEEATPETAAPEPVAITNCLNFGNPYDPEVYYQFAEALSLIHI